MLPGLDLEIGYASGERRRHGPPRQCQAGALEALVEARDQGLVRYIGVTGHNWTVAAMHLKSLERFDFDTVLLPYSYIVMQHSRYAADFEALFQLCQSRNVAVQTIKAITRRPWPENHDHSHATWYQPMTEQPEIDLAVHWVLGRDGVFLNTVGDIHVLPKVLDEKVARLHLAKIGVELETLTPEQADYIDVPVEGPYKSDLYRY